MEYDFKFGPHILHKCDLSIEIKVCGYADPKM